jgi:hypothetical protein
MKTATIIHYHVFGTMNTYYCCVLYRGKKLTGFFDYDMNPLDSGQDAMLNRAIQYTKTHGFTHYKIKIN